MATSLNIHFGAALHRLVKRPLNRKTMNSFKKHFVNVITQHSVPDILDWEASQRGLNRV